ncbi:MAG: PD-(D/E)XK nuclease family transposase [Bacteroidales bacterium]|nr:PD-(D/E)XK nuclease family transposase [Bacteroidales bacterium]
MDELEVKNLTYVNLLWDAGFKAVYADPRNKHHLINLLNNVLPDGVVVSEIVEYRDREQTRDSTESKKTVLDLVCRDDRERIFSVEVQREADWSMFKRCVFYASKQFHAQLLQGQEYETLRPVYEVAFLKDRLPHSKKEAWDTDHIISQFGFVENRTGEFAPPTIFITFVELGRFTKCAAECGSYRDRLFHWIKNGWMMNADPDYAGKDPEMRSLVEAARIAAFPPKKMEDYERELMTELDIIIANRRNYRKGLEEGEAKGKAEGEAKGIAKGAYDKAVSTARNLLYEGITSEVVAKCTGLSLEEVKALM